MTDHRVSAFNRRTTQRQAMVGNAIAAVTHKYGRGRREEIDGFKFPSSAEALRYEELKLLELAGEIKDLKVHPKFNININGVHIRRVELDFSYIEAKSGKLIHEDVKRERVDKRSGKVKFSTDTRRSVNGRRLLWAIYKIDVRIVK